MRDSKVLDIIITLRGAPDPLLGMMLDIARRCMSANGSAWQAHLQAELDTGLREAGIVAAPVTLAVNAATAEFFRPRKGLWFYDHKSFTDRVLTSARDDGIATSKDVTTLTSPAPCTTAKSSPTTWVARKKPRSMLSPLTR